MQAGSTLGHYQVVGLLGKGGMGEVYLADDTRLDRRVALKVLSPELASDPARRERFVREARAAAALNHPNIVTIHSVEEADGVAFLTLELIEGKTLADVLPPTGLPVGRLLAIAIPLADAVGAAHQRGITHRDLKPSNVMVTTDDRVKVLDFGLAKLREDVQPAVQTLAPTRVLTGEGRILGTAAYMSPEQAEAKEVDSRSDVFSLGVVLYEMAVGERPFKGDTQMSLLSSILRDTPPSVADIRRELPRDLARIVKRCLAKDPEDRYQSAKDLRNDLRALRDDLSSGEHASPVSSSGIVLPPATTSLPPSAIGGVDAPNAWRRNVLAGAFIIVLVAAAAVAWRATRPSAPANSATGPQLFTGMSLSRLTTTGTAGLAAVSADGRYVAHVVTDDAGRSLWLRQVATSSNVQIVPPADVRYAGISFSPDGDHVYYVTYPRGSQFAALTQVPVLGGGTRKVIDDVDSAPTFSPDGKRLAFVRGIIQGPAQGGAVVDTVVMVADIDGGNVHQIAERKPPLVFVRQSQTISWSPDGRLLAVAGEDSSKLQGQIVLVDVESGAERVLTGSEWRAVTSVAWAPDSSGVVANAQEAGSESSISQIWFIRSADGVGQRVTNDLSSYGGLSLSRDGRTLVTVRGEQRASIWIVPVTDKGQARTVTTGAGADDGVLGLSWAPDGRIVYASTASGNSDIYVMNADGTNRVPLTTSKSDDMLPHVTRDGRHVVYVSEEGGSRGVWRVDVSGGGFVRLGADSLSRSPWGPTLSADGKWAFFSNDGAVARKVAIDGSSVADVFTSTGGANLPPGFHDPNLSPDGRTIAGHYRDEATRGERLALVPLDNPGRFKLMPTVPNNAQWSPDSRSLLYFETQRGASNLYRQPVAGGPPVRLTHFEDLRIFKYELSPDENQIVLSRGATVSDVVLMTARERSGAGQP